MHSRDPYHYLHIAPMQIDKVLVTMTSDKVKTMTGDKVKTMTSDKVKTKTSDKVLVTM